MSGETHFEIFFKKNRKAEWALFDAKPLRDDAIKLASALMAENKEGSVKVTKEKFDPVDRVFKSVAVFEDGAEKQGYVAEKTGEAQLPCLTPEDLTKPHARETIRRVLSSWLERVSCIPMELLHRPDLVEKLEDSGTELQHAVQKVAVASAQGSDASSHGYVKQLNELVQKSLERIYQDGRKDKLASYPDGKSFDVVAAEFHAAGGSTYALRSAMVDRLKKENSYSAKLDVLLEMSDTLPADDDAREYARAEVDSCLSEVISFDKGFEAMLGTRKDLGETVERLTCLYDGDFGADALNLAPSTSKRMAKKINTNDLDACRMVIAKTLLKDLERPTRLRPTSIKAEVRLLRELAQKLVMGSGNILPIDALNMAFTARSSRLLTPDNIDELLKHSRDPNEEIDRLVKLEENLVGEANKKKLAGYIRQILTSHNTESFYVRGPDKPLERLASLTAHQGRVLKGSYPAEDKEELSKALDKMGMKVIDETKILNAVEGGNRPALDKATAFLKLATAGALPQGNCSADAQARALRHLKSQSGLNEAQDADTKHKLRAIQSMLGQIAAQQKAA